MRLRGVTDSQRQRDLIDIAFEARRKEFPLQASYRDIVHDFYVDLQQSVKRKPWSARFRTLRSRSHVYSFTHDRCITGSDQLRLLGWPTQYTQGMEQVACAELAEPGIPLPAVVIIETVMWANPFAPWNEGSR